MQQSSAFGFSGMDLVGSMIERMWNREAAEDATIASAEAAQRAMDFSADQSAKANWFTSNQGGIAREFNAEEAGKQRDFQERMSNSQWQRGVSDMQAAGLNPMLAYMHGGASSPSGAAGSIGAGSGAHSSGAVAQAFQAHPSSSQMSGSVSGRSASQVALDEAEAGKVKAETLPNDKLLEKLQAEIDYIVTQRATSSSQQNVNQQHAKVLREDSRIRLVEAGSAEAFVFRKNAAELDIVLAEATKMRTEKAIDESQFGVVLRYIERVIHTIGSGLGAAAGGFVGSRLGGGKPRSGGIGGITINNRMPPSGQGIRR